MTPSRLLFVCALFLGLSGAKAADLPPPVGDDDFRSYPKAQIELGQKLFYDRVLSGTYRVSCATCHNHDRASSNGVRIDGKEDAEPDSLAFNGLPVYDALKPSSRHAPPLFNLGWKGVKALFHDGRISMDDGKINTPAGGELPKGVRDLLAAQALFPAVTSDELVGSVESDVQAVAHLGNEAVWNALSKRVIDLPDYWPLFQKAWPELSSPDQITISEIVNAIGAFVASEWRADDASFDRYLKGNRAALTADQISGMKLFYGPAQCSTCHSGIFQTDQNYHFVPLGFWRFDQPVEERSADIQRSRAALTGRADDVLKIRTPSLRNVAKTAPYGHAGSIANLEDVLEQHVNANAALADLTAQIGASSAMQADQKSALQAKVDAAAQGAVAYPRLTEKDKELLIAFLESLTDENSLAGQLGKPEDVPSSLALD